jgi:hypothetical protein
MNNKIVLGYPYYGAFLWLLSAEQHYNKSIKDSYSGTHSYYKILFGKNHGSIIYETVSLSLLYLDGNTEDMSTRRNPVSFDRVGDFKIKANSKFIKSRQKNVLFPSALDADGTPSQNRCFTSKD